MTPELPQSIRYLIQPDKTRPVPVKRYRRRQPRDRQMRERRTAYFMMFFGIVLGSLELFIVLSYV
jgi:hypothetical protein